MTNLDSFSAEYIPKTGLIAIVGQSEKRRRSIGIDVLYLARAGPARWLVFENSATPFAKICTAVPRVFVHDEHSNLHPRTVCRVARSSASLGVYFDERSVDDWCDLITSEDCLSIFTCESLDKIPTVLHRHTKVWVFVQDKHGILPDVDVRKFLATMDCSEHSSDVFATQNAVGVRGVAFTVADQSLCMTAFRQPVRSDSFAVGDRQFATFSQSIVQDQSELCECGLDSDHVNHVVCVNNATNNCLFAFQQRANED